MTRYLEWARREQKSYNGARDGQEPQQEFGSNSLIQEDTQQHRPLDLERLKKNMRDAGKSDATQRHALCLVRAKYIQQGHRVEALDW